MSSRDWVIKGLGMASRDWVIKGLNWYVQPCLCDWGYKRSCATCRVRVGLLCPAGVFLSDLITHRHDHRLDLSLDSAEAFSNDQTNIQTNNSPSRSDVESNKGGGGRFALTNEAKRLAAKLL